MKLILETKNIYLKILTLNNLGVIKNIYFVVLKLLKKLIQN
jgi:hypothetical protein